ncbi:MAG: hypothetical protein GY842_00135, partial [bacterium]|nr:hypothetical protein [bacterium]
MSKSRYCRIVCTICAFAALAALPLGATAEESHRQSFDLGVEYDQELLHEEPACDLSDPAVVGTCGVSDSIDQCRWQPFKQAIDGGLCDTLVDPVERHVCRKGILLDGHLDDGLGVTGQCEYRTCGIEIGETPCPRSYFEAERAVAHVDQLATSDASGISDDPYDDCPSGFNVGCSLLWFEPDTDPMDGVDDSFLYVAWDVADPDVCGIFPGPPVQYDADVDGSACESQRIGFDERHNEDYELGLLSCDDLTRFDPNNATTNSVTLGPELSLVMEIQETGFEWDRTYLTTSDGTVLDTLSFPTADNATNPTNACIDNEIDFCAYRCSISGRPCVNGEACPAGEGTCDDLGNNVELVIKAVETSGVFGPHGRECIGNSAPCFSNYHCPGGGGGVCASTAAADSPEARENRFALAQLAAELRADSERDNSSEEQALVAQFTSLPGIEVKKLVRCVDPVGVFAEHAVALPGSKVEFEITIENTGNEDLSVTVQDVLTPISNKVSCEPVSETLEAFLTSPRRGLVSHEIRRNTADAISPPVCNPVIDETECLNVQFFVDLEVAPAQGFLGSIRNDETEALGTLLGVTLNRSTGECLFDPGDVMVVRFECLVNTSGVSTVSDLCDDPQTEDCTNAVTVSAPLLPPVAVTLGDSCPGGQHSECDDGLYCNGEEQCLGNVCQAGTLPCLLSEGCNEFTDSCGSIAVSDVADIIDTDREFVADDDDNVATVDLLCRDIDFVKEVQLDDSGVWKTGDDALNIPNGPFPLQIEYRYTVTNTGEIDEEVTLTDEFLCADLTAIAGVSYVTGQCDICELGTPGELVDTVPANSSRSYNCQVELTEAGLQEFLEQDDTGRPDCTAGAGDADCYRNCANISAEGMPLTGTCDSTPAIELESFSTICNQACAITVIKEVRCQEDCSTLLPDSEDGWVGHPDELDVAPGACVQYRITVENIGDDPLCAIEIIDCMVNSNNFASGPDQVQVVPPICTLTPPFNWDCDPFRCDPDPLLQAGDKVKILFMGRLKDKDNFIPNRDPLNVVDVRGALEGDCAGAEPNYSCDDDSTVGVDIQECSFTVEKSVTCDDPVVCNGCVPECVDALPGSTNGFRIEICNTGETNISTVGITDVLECESWYIGGSVNAFITNGGGTDDVTSCICETDACPTFDQINGVKGFKDCRPGSPYIPTGECLVITFKVEVPAVDPPDSCTNSVTVTADTDICEASDKNPCGVHSDDACIKVKEPDIECDKSVCLDENQNDECDEPDEPETDNLQLPCDIAFPFNLVYNFEVCNTGETPLINVRACDPDLVAHAVACGLLVGPCDLCDDPPPCDGNNDVCCEAPDLDPGECHTCRCTVQVPDRDAWECFAASDGGDENCHTNGAVANGDVDTSGLCSHGAETVVAADCGDVEVCLAPECEIEVTKQVQCLSSCLPEAPPIGALTDLLEVTPGSCVRYVIDIKNTSPDVPVCCVSIKDWLDPCVTLEPGTTQCSLEGQPCNACPLVATDGTPIEWCFENCPGTNNVLDPGETARIVFTGRMVCTNGFAQNRVEVEGATSCPVSAAPVYCCEDSSSCGVDIKDCSFTVDKDVTCDDPTDPNAVFQDDLVDALPGEEIGFRISICNTGDTNISTVGLDDDLGCEAWYVGGSVDAFITDGGGKDDVTTCVCETDACPTFGSLKELIDFKDCRPAAPYIPPGECLVISFRVKVPEVNPYPDECCNTATVTAKTDICEATEADPCGQEADTACINVLEP